MSKQRVGTLSQEQVRFYAENGYLHVKGVIDSWELERLRAESMKMIDHCKHVRPPNEDYRYRMDPVTGNSVLRRINYFAFFTIEEILSRGGPYDADLVRAWIGVMLQAVEARRQLPGAAGEEPFVYNPTLAEYKVEPGSLGYVERYIQSLPHTFDPVYRYSPHNPVKAAV